MRKKISFIFGTRPESIKLCPLVIACREHSGWETQVCVTGQHRQMLDQVLGVFGITPDVDLALMQPNQSLAALTSNAVSAIDGYLARAQPAIVIVQGDTTTVLCAALAAFYHKIRVGHVEAGLRTSQKFSPFPEEMNRVLASRLSDFHFAPTAGARDNLLREGVEPGRVFVTGNTVIDALQFALKKVRRELPDVPGVPRHLIYEDRTRKVVLITGHRRENFGRGFEDMCRAIALLAERFPDTMYIYPVHLNPNVQEPVYRILGGKNNIFLTRPLAYLPFVALLERADVVLTDSGGVQEEAPSLGKPVLVMRDTTERPEAVEAGTVRLVGTDADRIVQGVSELLQDEKAYQAMARAMNPYGDGRACARIIEALSAYL